MSAREIVPAVICAVTLSACNGLEPSRPSDSTTIPSTSSSEARASQKIYVANVGNATITTYELSGKEASPTINIGRNYLFSIAVDGNGKIYVLSGAHDGSPGIVTTYTPGGTPTTPTFRTGPDASALAIDANAGYLTSYDAGGHLGLRFAHERAATGGIAYAKGCIYVASSTAYRDILRTYTSDGKRTSPTITAGLYEPSGVVIH